MKKSRTIHHSNRNMMTIKIQEMKSKLRIDMEILWILWLSILQWDQEISLNF